jgi:hypothetical protein
MDEEQRDDAAREDLLLVGRPVLSIAKVQGI